MWCSESDCRSTRKSRSTRSVAESYSLRSVIPEGVSTSENLPPVLSNQPDSCARWSGQKTCLERRPFDDTGRRVATSAGTK